MQNKEHKQPMPILILIICGVIISSGPLALHAKYHNDIVVKVKNVCDVDINKPGGTKILIASFFRDSSGCTPITDQWVERMFPWDSYMSLFTVKAESTDEGHTTFCHYNLNVGLATACVIKPEEIKNCEIKATLKHVDFGFSCNCKIDCLQQVSLSDNE